MVAQGKGHYNGQPLTFDLPDGWEQSLHGSAGSDHRFAGEQDGGDHQ